MPDRAVLRLQPELPRVRPLHEFLRPREARQSAHGRQRHQDWDQWPPEHLHSPSRSFCASRLLRRTPDGVSDPRPQIKVPRGAAAVQFRTVTSVNRPNGGTGAISAAAALLGRQQRVHGEIRMPAEAAGGRGHRPFHPPTRPALGGEVIDEEDVAARPHHPAQFRHQRPRVRHHRGHEHRHRDVERRLGESGRLGVEFEQCLDIGEALGCHPLAGARQHLGAQIDAGDPLVPSVARQGEAGADAHLEHPLAGERVHRRHRPAAAEGGHAAEHGVVHRCPALVRGAHLLGVERRSRLGPARTRDVNAARHRSPFSLPNGAGKAQQDAKPSWPARSGNETRGISPRSGRDAASGRAVAGPDPPSRPVSPPSSG